METTDWWIGTGASIAGSQSAVEGLEKRCLELEEIVEPHLSTRKTKDSIRFRTEARYVTPPADAHASQVFWSAAFGLQCVYRAQNAIDTGNIERAAIFAYAMCYYDIELQFLKKTPSILNDKVGFDPGSLLAVLQLKKWQEKQRGRGTKIDIPRTVLELVVAKNAHRKNWLAATTHDLRELHRIEVDSSRTVSRRMKELGIKRPKLSRRPK